MQADVLEKYTLAGEITRLAKEEARKIVRVGTPLLEIVEHLEKFMREKGGEPAFPVNISINDVAAHYTPTKGDTSSVRENDMVKIDLGVHVDGYVADTAVAINLNPDFDNLAKAAEDALHNALKLVHPGALLSNVSEEIERTIKDAGFKPISNLTGHGVNRWDLHSEPTVPNVSFKSDYTLEENQVIAIEPFATDGAGMVKDSEQVFIFTLFEGKPVRNQDARKIIELFEKRNGLPFAERWVPIDSLFRIRLALRELRERGLLHDYFVLKEAGRGCVSQAEHTLIVKDKPIVLT